ncbi:YerC/YecD family TrpR-related protein [Paenibacillus sp. N1-5-1-14]|uniref:YerC/YecD family TrpR-related protein n=1 Tax=Paenibacillus radicibacter TaxID=2972488 RepID=UPI0021595F5A|nr:YerC/YecD family TrpR-related protein [Paenibacillus radicibacter]MCR8641248.1 YerC/YecD family TrpR-related protein [Paenibacillus radicibacter]
MQQDKMNEASIEQLFELIVAVKDLEECQAFLEDLCTYKELQSMAQRCEVAKLLLEGRTYLEIEAETGASTAIISRVKRCLSHGNGGISTLLERINMK